MITILKGATHRPCTGAAAAVRVAVAVAVVAALLAAAAPPAAAQRGPFRDVAGGVHAPAVEALDAKGIFDSTECGTRRFCPGDAIDRKTMAVWIVRALDGADPSRSRSRFDDVDCCLDGFWVPFIERMAQLKVTEGCGDGTRYCPDDPVTRAQMAAFLSRAFKLPEAKPAAFTDVPPRAWYARNVAKLAASGVTAGCGDGSRYCPDDPTTRAEMATFIARALGLVESPRPPSLPTSTAANTIAAGWLHSCAIVADDTITCWGYNGNGETDAPAGKYKAITAGTSHSCAIATDDTITCWGWNDDGATNAPAGKYKAIAANDYSCAIATDGTITCWGVPLNDYGQTDAPAGKYKAITAGWLHSCAIATDDTITCWGDNNFGRTDAPAGKYKAIAAGTLHSCAIATDDTITCWGMPLNDRGQTDAPAGKYKAITANSEYSCAIATDDTITCWGWNDDGATNAPAGKYKAITAGNSACAIAIDDTITCWGDNDFGQSNVPAALSPRPPSPSVSAATNTITAGYAHSCAIAADDTITCWGPHTDPPAGAYKAIAGAFEHSCAIAADDTITCWGHTSSYGDHGQVDPPAGRYKAISAGYIHACALATDDTIRCWGSNNHGEADAPRGAYKAIAVGVNHSCAIAADDTITCWGPHTDPPAGAYKAIAAGADYTCAIAADGTITCWGDYVGRTDAPKGAYKTITAGDLHACALATDDTIRCWGSNDDPWGLSRAGQADPPAGAYKAITAGGYHSCAIAIDDTITCWGHNHVGQTDVPAALSPRPPVRGVRVIAGRANWVSGYFQAELYKLLLEELGYDVSDPADLELGPATGYVAMAEGWMDYWPNSWYPIHLAWLAGEMPDGTLVGDHVTAVGRQMIAHDGFVVTKSFADRYGVYTVDDLNSNARALAAFDATDPRPGNGKADIFGCSESWPCADIIADMIAFGGWDNIRQITQDYYAMFAEAADNAGRGVPMVAFTWTPSVFIAELRPGDNVYWMGVDDILDDQRGADGTGGFASIGRDQCPSAAEQPSGLCKIGWIANDIRVTARNGFLDANPAAKRLFEVVELPVTDVSLAALKLQQGADAADLAARWIADNRSLVDRWLAAALAAA